MSLKLSNINRLGWFKGILITYNIHYVNFDSFTNPLFKPSSELSTGYQQEAVREL